VRPSPLPAQTAQTPALPGFRVSGDAKNAGFESFAASPGYHPIRADGGISDPSALRVAKEPVSPATRAITPFERVQIDAPLEHRAQAGFAIHVPQQPSERLAEAAALEPSPLHRSSERQRESSAFDPSLVRRAQVTISSQPCATSDSFGHISAGLFERRPGADALDSSFHRPSVQRRPKAGASSRPSLRQLFERVQMMRRRSLLPEHDGIETPSAISEFLESRPDHVPFEHAQTPPTASPSFWRSQGQSSFERVQMDPVSGPSLRSPSDRSLFERVQTASIARQFPWRHLGLGGTLCKRLESPPAASESRGTRLDDAPFERVQIAGAAGHFSIPSRPPSLEPRPSAPRATHARPNPTAEEEIRMPPPQ
jgi:hypothetical protein